MNVKLGFRKHEANEASYVLFSIGNVTPLFTAKGCESHFFIDQIQR